MESAKKLFHCQTNFGFTKLGSNMHSFRVKALSNWKIWSGTPCTTWKWNLKWINNKSYACLSQDLLKKVTLKVCKFYSNKSCIQARDVFSTHKLHTHTIEKEWICNCVGALKKNKNPHLRWKWNAQFRMMVNFCHEFCVHTTTMI